MRSSWRAGVHILPSPLRDAGRRSNTSRDWRGAGLSRCLGSANISEDRRERLVRSTGKDGEQGQTVCSVRVTVHWRTSQYTTIHARYELWYYSSIQKSGHVCFGLISGILHIVAITAAAPATVHYCATLLLDCICVCACKMLEALDL